MKLGAGLVVLAMVEMWGTDPPALELTKLEIGTKIEVDTEPTRLCVLGFTEIKSQLCVRIRKLLHWFGYRHIFVDLCVLHSGRPGKINSKSSSISGCSMSHRLEFLIYNLTFTVAALF